MWGTKSWGEMVWGDVGDVGNLVPSLDPASLVLLVVVMIGSFFLTRSSFGRSR